MCMEPAWTDNFRASSAGFGCRIWVVTHQTGLMRFAESMRLVPCELEAMPVTAPG